MLALVVSFLIGMYILKIFFPQEFVMYIQNDKLIAIGNYIDSHTWSYYALGIVTSFITYALYLCATTRRLWLTFKQTLAIIVTIGLSIGLSFVDAELVTYVNIFSFIILPCIFKADLKTVTCVYSIHGLAQILSLKIRNLPMYVQYYNVLFATLLTLEMYLWLLLFYIIFNYKKKEV